MQKYAISKVLNKLQAFHFRCTVHTNTTPTVITHSCVLQNHRPATIMVTSLSLRFVDQIGTSVRFCPAKRLHWQRCHLGGSYLFMKYDVIQNAEFFLGIELINFKVI